MEDESAPPIETNRDPEFRRMLGMFDAPAFARRGQELEYSLNRLHERLGRHRFEMLEMARLRLRQWAASATGPDDWSPTFLGPIDGYWPLAGAEAPTWADRPGTERRRRAVARDLVASLERFNARWAAFLDALKLDAVNRAIEHYNRYYLLEKECVFGSARIAARHFTPRPSVTTASLLAAYPPIAPPGLG